MNLLAPRPWSLALLGALLVPCSAAADTLTVGPPGSGADFTEIQAAADAAASGDVIQVFAGTYGAFELAKPLVVRGAGAGETIVRPSLFESAVVVDGLDEGSVAVVAGLAVRPLFSFPSPAPAISVTDSDGLLVLHEVVHDWEQMEFLTVLDSAAVVLSRTTAFGPGFSGSTGPAPMVELQGSALWMVDSSLLDENDGNLFAEISFLALLMQGSEVHLSGSLVDGQDMPEVLLAHDGGDGIQATDSTLTIARTSVHGGDGSTDEATAGGYGLRLVGDTLATLFADAGAVGGTGGDPPSQQAAVSLEGGAQVHFAPAVRPTSSAVPDAGGTTLAVSLYGEPGARGLLLGSLDAAGPTDVAGVSGDLFLDLPSLLNLGAVQLDAAGTLQIVLPLPSAPELAGRLAVLQWVATSGGVLEASNPAFHLL